MLAWAAQAADVGDPGWLGIELERSPSVEATGGAAEAGVQVSGVVAGSPAERAGLRARDRVLALDHEPVLAPEELRGRLREKGSGSWVTLTVERGGEELTLDARLRAAPQQRSDVKMLVGWIGVEAIDLPGALREHFGAPPGSGIMVSGVEPGGPAAIAGIEVGDVIHAVDGEEVPSAGAFAMRIGRGGVGNRVELALARAGAAITVEAAIGVRPAP
jgi:serine protease Do